MEGKKVVIAIDVCIGTGASPYKTNLYVLEPV